MPGAADAPANHEALGERPVVMTAIRVDGENLRPRTHQQHILIADMPEQGFAGEIIGQYTFGQVRPGRRSLLFSHVSLPWMLFAILGCCFAIAVPLTQSINP